MKKTVIGLTGNMASGKSTASKMIQQMVIPVFDADKTVHRMMKENKAMKSLFFRRFPDSIIGDEIKREVLAEKISAGLLHVQELEKMIYPYLEEELKDFFARHMYEPIVVIDAPLLYEAGWDKYCDKIIMMTASVEVLKKRIFERPGMTEEKYEALMNRQNIKQKRTHEPDYVINSAEGMEAVQNKLIEIVDEIRCGK